MAKKSISILSLCIILVIFISIFITSITAIGQTILPSRSLKIDSSAAGATNVQYNIGFDVSDQSEIIGSVKVTFCANSPFINTFCEPINGFDLQNALFLSQSGPNDFGFYSSPTTNSVILSRPATAIGSQSIGLTLSGVTNPSNKGTYFGRIQTFSSQDANGPTLNSGGVTFAIVSPIALNTVVPPYLYLCVGIVVSGLDCNNSVGNFIDLGELSSNKTSTGTSQFIVATNAGSGFNVAIKGSAPSAGSNIINALQQRQYSQFGLSQFGINLRKNTIPNIGEEPVGAGSGVINQDYGFLNEFIFNSGDYIVYSNDATLDRKFTVSYIVNVSRNQRPGVYSATYLYTAIAML